MAQIKIPVMDDYQPAGRLVSVLCPDEQGADNQAADHQESSLYELALSLGKKAASFGETVLLLDACGGRMMQAANIIYNITLANVIHEDAALRDALYITSNEHFTAAALGDIELNEALGSLAALSLSYDWVIVLPPMGCTPAHTRLAVASDVSVLSYDTKSDNFMRAYWMLEAIRRRSPKFDPFIVSTGRMEDAVETALMLSDTVRDHLGAPPPYAGHIQDLHLETRLLHQMRAYAAGSKVA